jgi:autophagy-related protein 5
MKYIIYNRHYPVGVLFDILGVNIPWSIIVHFQGFPQDKLIKFLGEETVKSHFLNVIKESTFLKYGDCTRYNLLSVSETNDLWEGFKNHNFDQFWLSNKKLIISDFQFFKHIPIRLFYQKQFRCYQDLISPFDSKGNSKSLGDILKELLPELFSKIEQENENMENGILEGIFPKVMIQGIYPSYSTPIVWLCENMCYPDNFLYFIIITKE